jgi:hypothetical protein
MRPQQPMMWKYFQLTLFNPYSMATPLWNLLNVSGFCCISLTGHFGACILIGLSLKPVARSLRTLCKYVVSCQYLTLKMPGLQRCSIKM